jgi:hypothetical protein
MFGSQHDHADLEIGGTADLEICGTGPGPDKGEMGPPIISDSQVLPLIR